MRKIATLHLAAAALAAVGWLAVCSNADAGPNKKKGAERLFDRIDTNHDGKISKEEWAKFREERAAKKGKTPKQGKGKDRLFAKLDTNGDGFLSLDEFKKLSELETRKKQK